MEIQPPYTFLGKNQRAEELHQRDGDRVPQQDYL
jgi:hypothetical protein